MTIGENIKRLRKEQKLTQKELGEKLGGISQQQIGQWETGKANPKIETIEKIAKALNASLLDFLDNDYFSAITTMNIDSENEFLEQKFLSIADNENLNEKEKDVLMEEFLSQVKIMDEHHSKNVEAANKYLLFKYFNQLNIEGQFKAVEQIELLAKIPEYQRNLQE